MKYADYRTQHQFDKQKILALGHGNLVEDPPDGFAGRLPIPPMLMIDRVLEIRSNGSRGKIVAERDVHLDDWFFQCHFLGDPVQPGCLGVDGVWQLLGLYCSWSGGLGTGRALGCGEVEFFGQIRPHDKVVRYDIDIRRYSQLPSSGSVVVIGDATLSVDGDEIYSVKRAKVGFFQGIEYRGYPHRAEHSRGGKLER